MVDKTSDVRDKKVYFSWLASVISALFPAASKESWLYQYRAVTWSLTAFVVAMVVLSAVASAGTVPAVFAGLAALSATGPAVYAILCGAVAFMATYGFLGMVECWRNPSAVGRGWRMMWYSLLCAPIMALMAPLVGGAMGFNAFAFFTSNFAMIPGLSGMAASMTTLGLYVAAILVGGQSISALLMRRASACEEKAVSCLLFLIKNAKRAKDAAQNAQSIKSNANSYRQFATRAARYRIAAKFFSVGVLGGMLAVVSGLVGAAYLGLKGIFTAAAGAPFASSAMGEAIGASVGIAAVVAGAVALSRKLMQHHQMQQQREVNSLSSQSHATESRSSEMPSGAQDSALTILNAQGGPGGNQRSLDLQENNAVDVTQGDPGDDVEEVPPTDTYEQSLNQIVQHLQKEATISDKSNPSVVSKSDWRALFFSSFKLRLRFAFDVETDCWKALVGAICGDSDEMKPAIKEHMGGPCEAFVNVLDGKNISEDPVFNEACKHLQSAHEDCIKTLQRLYLQNHGTDVVQNVP